MIAGDPEWDEAVGTAVDLYRWAYMGAPPSKELRRFFKLAGFDAADPDVDRVFWVGELSGLFDPYVVQAAAAELDVSMEDAFGVIDPDDPDDAPGFGSWYQQPSKFAR